MRIEEGGTHQTTLCTAGPICDGEGKVQGGIVTWRSVAERKQYQEEPVFYVRDNGIGIDACFHEKAFGLFDQINPRAEGTGIGLAVVKRIIDVHGGRIWVESEGDGEGSTFCFTIPREAAPEGMKEMRVATHAK